MRVFVAGATGAIGRPLVRGLVAAGHEVGGLTRKPERAASLRAAGAVPFVGDALDRGRLRDALAEFGPEAVIDQLTDLPQRIGFRGLRRFYRNQGRLRRDGSGALLEAAVEVGARRLIAQSVAFIYAPGGLGPKAEADRLWLDAPEPFGGALRLAAHHEQRVLHCDRIEGIVLRYGILHGPGTHFAPGNGIYEDVRRRRMPIVGTGDSIWSFCHVEDAAAATVLALERGEPGVLNIVDDDPARTREWLPAFAAAIDAAPPRHVPTWLARVAVGPAMTAWATRFPGASNAKARSELRWEPLLPSWRPGLMTGKAVAP